MEYGWNLVGQISKDPTSSNSKLSFDSNRFHLELPDAPGDYPTLSLGDRGRKGRGKKNQGRETGTSRCSRSVKPHCTLVPPLQIFFKFLRFALFPLGNRSNTTKQQEGRWVKDSGKFHSSNVEKKGSLRTVSANSRQNFSIRGGKLHREAHNPIL